MAVVTKIDHRLNFVIPVTRDDGVEIYVHSAPIAREVFERHFLVMGKTFAALWSEGLGAAAGPRIAAMLLKQIAVAEDAWDGPNGVNANLMAEIKRLTNVLVPGANGWEVLPYQEAINASHLNEDDASEVENAIVYFTLASCMYRKAQLLSVLKVVGGLWSARTELSNCTVFAASLPTSTAIDNSQKLAKGAADQSGSPIPS